MGTNKDKQEKSDKPKRERGRPPELELHSDAKAENIAWALKNTTPKELAERKNQKATLE